jgi:hypothetical protein
VAGCVGDDERAARRGEEPVGDIDGDALLALGLEAVDQQREIDLVAGCAVLDFPSSTEPQVKKRNRSLAGCSST